MSWGARKTTGRPGRALVVVAALAFSLPARAEIPAPPSKPTPADEATAKKSFEAGLKLYGEGKYGDALAAFESSYRLGGRPSALKNLAQCHRNLKHFVDAHDAYEQLLALHGDKLAKAERTVVEQAESELAVLTGVLTFKVTEPDAEVEIDGKPFARTPIAKPKRLLVGTHRIRVTKEGFEPFDQNVTLGSEETRAVEANLVVDRQLGRVLVREPAGRAVHVFIDGTDKGPAPWEGDLPAGEHLVEARGARYAAAPRRIKVVSKERLDVAIDAASLAGHLRVVVTPSAATIKVDGRDVGAGAWEGDLAEGVHLVEASVAGQPAESREVKVGRGQTIVQEIAVGGPKSVDYRGVYVALSLQPYFLLGGYATNHARGVATAPAERLVLGGGAAAHAGYSFGWFSLEVTGAFMVEHRREQQKIPESTAAGGSTSVLDRSTAPNVFLGLGPRITTKDDLIRFTVGVAPGIAIKRYNLTRELGFRNNVGERPPGPTTQSYSEGYAGFGLNADAGLLLGSTPGTKLFVGVHTWLDFPGNDLTVGPDTITVLADGAYRAPGRRLVVVDQPQFFVGPVIGFRTGK